MSKIIGIFGGAFDPVHIGHTESIANLKNELEFEKIHIVPCNIQALKGSSIASPNERLKMLEIAFKDQSNIYIDDREIIKGGTSYTYETIRNIKAEYPDKNHFSFIMGIDAFLDFKKWKNWLNILEMCSIIILQRPNYEITKELLSDFKDNITSDIDDVLSQSGKIIFTDISLLNISSSEIRDDLEVDSLNEAKIDKEVVNFIKKNLLYIK
jgi:nicotinate-nucleotide adenylyltransferase